MRRAPIALVAALVALPVVAACSGSGGSSNPSSPAASGQAAGSASPSGSGAAGTAPVSTETDPASPSAAGGTELPACLHGTWSAPLQREAGNLGLAKRSGGLVRSATGIVTMTFTPSSTWTLKYDQVKVGLPVGDADVAGSMNGTYRLVGNTLRTTVGTSSVTVKAKAAGVTVDAPQPVSAALASLQPDGVFVTCKATTLELQFPTAQGGGTATFDAASA